MNTHNFVFWICAFFLIGVFLISITNQILFIFLITALVALYFIFLKKFYFVLLAGFIVIGAFYYQAFSAVQNSAKIPFYIQGEYSGVVKDAGSSFKTQSLTVDLINPYSGAVRVNAPKYPSFNYGDLIKFRGIIGKPDAKSADYLAKEGILGVSNQPDIELMGTGKGNFLKSKLLNFKETIVKTFTDNLPSEKAIFLSGLTLGERQEFSKELKDKMSLSGTTHLVALSGYNISVISIAVGLIFGLYFSRTLSFYLSVLVIFLFVLMTGAQASAVRAAIMGIIALTAKESERLLSVRNSIVIAAFLMTLFNPRVLVFDVGFQLSFAALMGIVYLEPVLKRISKIEQPGFFSWKKNMLTTFAAQLAVAPILISAFGKFSLLSFLANIMILEAIPLTMGLGFLMGGVGLFSQFLAKIIGLILNLFLSYELWVIDIFSKFSFPIFIKSLNFPAIIIYYLLLAGFIFYYG